MPYQKHFFLCTNKRENGTGCGHMGSDDVRNQLKKNIVAAPPSFRINTAGCLGHCDFGPTLVVYPEGKWYTYFDYSDAEKIVHAHLNNGEGPEDLMLATNVI